MYDAFKKYIDIRAYVMKKHEKGKASETRTPRWQWKPLIPNDSYRRPKDEKKLWKVVDLSGPGRGISTSENHKKEKNLMNPGGCKSMNN